MPDDEGDVHPERVNGVLPHGPGVGTEADAREFRFTLYISGATAMSQRAVANARRLCDEHLAGCYTLEVIDINMQPELARSKDIFAIPTLIRELPRPIRRFVGDLSANERLVIQMTRRDVPALSEEPGDGDSHA